MGERDLFDIPPARREQQLAARGGMADAYGPAHARQTDPPTSHKAAREVTPHTDTLRADVERWASGRGPEGFIDEELSVAFDAADSSSYRTRRAELTQAGVIVNTGRHRLNGNGRSCIVWMHRTFRGQPAMPDRPLTMREKLERHANRLRLSASQMKAEGRTAFAAELVETADLIVEALGPQKPPASASEKTGA